MRKQTEKQIDKVLSELNVQRTALLQHKKDLQGLKMIRCVGCEKKSQIKKWIVISLHHYVSPHGCTGGDYWNFSHDYYVVCPKCDEVNRAYRRDTYDDEADPRDKKENDVYYLIHDRVEFFAEQLDMYERDSNFDLDDLREEDRKRKENRRW